MYPNIQTVFNYILKWFLITRIFNLQGSRLKVKVQNSTLQLKFENWRLNFTVEIQEFSRFNLERTRSCVFNLNKNLGRTWLNWSCSRFVWIPSNICQTCYFVFLTNTLRNNLSTLSDKELLIDSENLGALAVPFYKNKAQTTLTSFPLCFVKNNKNGKFNKFPSTLFGKNNRNDQFNTFLFNVSGATLIPIAWMPLLCHCTKTGFRQV